MRMGCKPRPAKGFRLPELGDIFALSRQLANISTVVAGKIIAINIISNPLTRSLIAISIYAKWFIRFNRRGFDAR